MYICLPWKPHWLSPETMNTFICMYICFLSNKHVSCHLSKSEIIIFPAEKLLQHQNIKKKQQCSKKRVYLGHIASIYWYILYSIPPPTHTNTLSPSPPRWEKHFLMFLNPCLYLRKEEFTCIPFLLLLLIIHCTCLVFWFVFFA